MRLRTLVAMLFLLVSGSAASAVEEKVEGEIRLRTPGKDTDFVFIGDFELMLATAQELARLTSIPWHSCHVESSSVTRIWVVCTDDVIPVFSSPSAGSTIQTASH